MRRFDPFMSDNEIATIGNGLLDRTLPKTAWTHAAHFAATLWLLQCRPEVEISHEMPGIIRGYNEATGGANTDTTRLPRDDHSGFDSGGSRFSGGGAAAAAFRHLQCADALSPGQSGLAAGVLDAFATIFCGGAP
jgi:hypothetical protein